ncbi:DUF3293 domain-containing protein [Mycobacterium bourgelatii]|uniref:Uncharacterized protein n=1 Tax=Mycobacterium bourgelatii TaxID=1273442 RepID=A0A7I9YRW2_MYCBU|nr:DUF3293 domain-containing protein [Mycobacterium bourgelatii]MCV6974051.1 DUF3293 domain-containing protein [Mycobacterium bourgelatii]GFG91406.1 hypothetical protein MBOU_34480 [Mycobacterium bourgelatii]
MHTYDDFDWVEPGELKTMAMDDILWNLYLATKVNFYIPKLGGIVWPVDSHGEDDPPLGPLHVVTAVQPKPNPDSDDNLARIEVLEYELRVSGRVSIRAVGTSFDGTHSEESRAVFGLDDDEARSLGRRFGQVAIFSWAGSRWSLLASAHDRETHGSWRWEADV